MRGVGTCGAVAVRDADDGAAAADALHSSTTLLLNTTYLLPDYHY